MLRQIYDKVKLAKALLIDCIHAVIDELAAEKDA